jgi:nucleoside-diphosphate-sugar epimerase
LTTVFITGGNGFIGSHLVDKLLIKNFRVKCLVRKTSNLKWLKDKPVELIYGNLFSEEILLPVLKECDYVYHVAGVTFAKKKADYFAGNVDATRSLLENVFKANQNLKKFVHISSQTAAGPSYSAQPVDETAECSPITTYGKSKLEAEKAVMEYFDKMNSTIVRLPAVYGPRDVAIYEYFKTINKRLEPLIGFSDKLVSLIHVRDAVNGMILAAESEKSKSQTYFISSNRPYSWKEIGEMTSRLMNKKTLRIRIPHFMVYVVGAFAEFFSLFSSKPAILNIEKCRDITQKFWTCSAEKATRELGYKESVNIEDGFKETIEWYKQMKWI